MPARRRGTCIMRPCRVFGGLVCNIEIVETARHGEGMKAAGGPLRKADASMRLWQQGGDGTLHDAAEGSDW